MKLQNLQFVITDVKRDLLNTIKTRIYVFLLFNSLKEHSMIE